MITNINPNYDIEDELVGYVMENTAIDEFTNSLKMYIPLIHPLVNGYNKPIEEEYYLRMNGAFLNDSSCKVKYNEKIGTRNFINVHTQGVTEFKSNGISILNDTRKNKVIKKGTRIICKIYDNAISNMRFYDPIINYTADDEIETDNPIEPIVTPTNIDEPDDGTNETPTPIDNDTPEYPVQFVRVLNMDTVTIDDPHLLFDDRLDEFYESGDNNGES